MVRQPIPVATGHFCRGKPDNRRKREHHSNWTSGLSRRSGAPADQLSEATNSLASFASLSHMALAEGLTAAHSFMSRPWPDRKSTRLNSSHHSISYAVFCLKKK